MAPFGPGHTALNGIRCSTTRREPPCAAAVKKPASDGWQPCRAVPVADTDSGGEAGILVVAECRGYSVCWRRSSIGFIPAH